MQYVISATRGPSVKINDILPVLHVHSWVKLGADQLFISVQLSRPSGGINTQIVLRSQAIYFFIHFIINYLIWFLLYYFCDECLTCKN